MSVHTYLSIDTETGGLSPLDNPLLQVGFGIYALDDSTLQYTTAFEGEWILKPSQFWGTTMDKVALEKNGLDPDVLERDGSMVEEVGKVLEEQLKLHEVHNILGQNLRFDLGFLRKYLPASTVAALDALRYKDLMDVSSDYNMMVCDDWDHMPSRSLGAMAPRLGVKNEHAHTALSDARATFKCMVELFKRFRMISSILKTVKSIDTNLHLAKALMVDLK